jgi:riboflavin kinase/FMN adenylyltransferase
VEPLHTLQDQPTRHGLDALTAGISKDCAEARAYFASVLAPNHTETRRQTTRDRI